MLKVVVGAEPQKAQTKKAASFEAAFPFTRRGLPSPTGVPAQAASAADPPQEALPDAPFQTPIVPIKQKRQSVWTALLFTRRGV